MINMANEFEKIFDRLTNQHDPNKIFNEFLDYCIDINLFTTRSQDLDFQGREKYYFEMFKEWIKITNRLRTAASMRLTTSGDTVAASRATRSKLV